MRSHRPSHELAVAAPVADLALSFVNTRYWRGSEAPTEELNGIDDLLAWCGAKTGAAAELLERARSELAAGSAEAERAFAEAIALREALCRIFAATAEGAEPMGPDLAILDRVLAAAPPRARIARTGEAFAWRLATAAPALSLLIAPILWSAADLLTGTRLDRVRRCSNPRCQWIFLDDSKSATRRWCMMSGCGNRAKAERHRAKLRAEAVS